MSLSTYALISLDELRAEVGSARADQDEALSAIVNRASAQIEAYLDRQIVSRSTLTEYHSLDINPPWTQNLDLMDWPIISVASVAEDDDWQSTATGSRYATALTVNTDYVVSKPHGRLVRVDDYWMTGFRSIKVVYIAGYATTADVPWEIKDVCLRLCTLSWRDSDRHEWGLLSRSDATGTVNRFVPAVLTDGMKADLAQFRRRGTTGERDA
jgi:hypothetical protein